MLVVGFPAGSFAAPTAGPRRAGRGEQCVIIDPAMDVRRPALDDLLAEHRLHPVAVVLTHGHLDHTFSVVPVCEAARRPRLRPPGRPRAAQRPDAELGPERGRRRSGSAGSTFAEPDDVRELADGATLALAGLELGVQHAPGPHAGLGGVPRGHAAGRRAAGVRRRRAVRRLDRPHRPARAAATEAMLDAPAPRRPAAWPTRPSCLPGHGPSTTIGRERGDQPVPADATSGAIPRTAMSRPPPLSAASRSGCPPQRIVEQRVLDTHPRAPSNCTASPPIETRAVEPLDQLLRKGETDKEVYVLRRLQAADDDDPTPRGLGLHFDLTVPFARYVLENAGKLEFPFRRYQIQKVWRGERPQEGRYREFLQADIDVVGGDTLPFHYEVELPLVIADALAALPLPPMPRMHVNNRSWPRASTAGSASTDPARGAACGRQARQDRARRRSRSAARRGRTVSAAQAAACLRARRRSAPTDASFADRVARARRQRPAARRGPRRARPGGRGRRRARARAGWWPTCGSRAGSTTTPAPSTRPCSPGTRSSARSARGGRYDSLASDGRDDVPGRRHVDRGHPDAGAAARREGCSKPRRAVPTCVLVAVPDEDGPGGVRPRWRRRCAARGIATEVAPGGGQVRQADPASPTGAGIPYVWFPADAGDGAGDEVQGHPLGRPGRRPIRKTWAAARRSDLRPTVRPAARNERAQ